MKSKKIILKNNLPVYLIKIPQAKSSTVLVMCKTGSKYENRKNAGISHFLEHMFFKGTANRPNTINIAGDLDSIGAEFNAFTGKEYTGYYVKAQKKKFDVAVDVLSDMLLNSKFEQEEINRERGVIIEELNMYEDNPMMNIEDLFESCLYGDTPAGWDTIGFKDTILSVNREDFVDYFNKQYGTKSMAIFVAGDFKESELKKILEEKFLSLKKNDYQNKLKVVEKQKSPNLKIKKKKTDQMTISLGFRSFASGHKDEVILKLLSIILGGSMSSRLFTELRERRGFAYYVRAGVEFYSDCGYISAQAGIPKNKLKESIEVILGEYKKLKTDLVSKKELQKAKDLLSGKMIVSLEGTDDFTTWYGRQFPFTNKFLSPDEFLKKIKKVSADDIMKVAKNIFTNNRLNLAVIGEETKIDLKKILKV